MGNDKPIGHDKPEDLGLLPLSMVSSKRTGGDGAEKTTCTADYAYLFVS